MLELKNFTRISMVFQDICLFPRLSKPGILNYKTPGLSRVCTNPADWLIVGGTYNSPYVM